MKNNTTTQSDPHHLTKWTKGCVCVINFCILPDKGPGYGQDSAYEPCGMSDDQRLQVLPQSAITVKHKTLKMSN